MLCFNSPVYLKPQGGSEPTVTGAIRMPQALEFIGANYPTTQDSTILLVFYDDPKDKVFTMSKNRIPGAWAFYQYPQQYAVRNQGTSHTPDKRRIHLAFQNVEDGDKAIIMDISCTVSAPSSEGQGGQLSTFTSDLPTMFQRVKTKALVPKHGINWSPRTSWK